MVVERHSSMTLQIAHSEGTTFRGDDVACLAVRKRLCAHLRNDEFSARV